MYPPREGGSAPPPRPALGGRETLAVSGTGTAAEPGRKHTAAEPGRETDWYELAVEGLLPHSADRAAALPAGSWKAE